MVEAKKPAFWNAHFAAVKVTANVAAGEPINIIEDTRFGHGAAASYTFFGRLKEDFECSAEFVFMIPEPMGYGLNRLLYERRARRRASRPVFRWQNLL